MAINLYTLQMQTSLLLGIPLTLIDHFEALGSAPGIVNPFEHTAHDCWTLVDFDRDGDLDLVKVGPANPSAATPTAWGFGREVRYYENATWNRC